jgi:endoglucanase
LSSCASLSGPTAHVNQLGYLPQARKIAIVESDAKEPQPFQLTDATGKVVYSGKTTVRGPDKESGDDVHWADFSELEQPGKGYKLLVDGGESYSFVIDARVYRPLKYDALAFFYHQRSGVPIVLPYAGEFRWTHAPGHLSDRSVSCINRDCGYELDVLGGWYDAGDHGKYVVNGGISTWTLLDLYERTRYLGSSLDDFADGKLNIPESKNGVPDLLDEARYELEFLLKMQVPPGHEKSGMVHHKIHDSSWTPLGMAPPPEWKERFLYPPSTAATLNLAANAAQCFRIWRDIDADFAERCRLAAIRAWNAAQKFPKVFAPQYANQGGGPYDDSDVSDETYWAAAELYISFKTPDLLSALESSPHHATLPPQLGHEHVKNSTLMTWQSTAALGAISLAVVPDSLPDPAQIDAIKKQIVQAADAYLAIEERQGYRQPLEAGSNGHYPWGSNSVVANNALIMALAHDFTREPRYLDGVVQGLDYLLGRNPLGLSYVTGYGEHAFENPHHRFWAHQKKPSFPSPPPGVLAGGPNSRLQDPTASRLGKCPPARCYIDHVDAWSVNEVAINWNAPLAWIAAFVDEHGQGGTKDEAAAPAASEPAPNGAADAKPAE